MPSFFTRLKTFAKSLVWHIGAGMPKSGQQEIDRRLGICNNCELMDKKNNKCLVCGCNINDKNIFMNKLAWKDQKCPVGRW